MSCRNWMSLLLLSFLTSSAAGLCSEDSAIDPEPVRAAIARAIPLLERGAAGSADQRTCFTCHNQAVPVFALAEARRRGFDVDEEELERQARHTHEHLERGLQNYLDGRGQGGKVITAGYALWTLDAVGRQGDNVTRAVSGYLLTTQNDADRWSHPGRRPPSSGSDFTATYVALRGLSTFATDDRQTELADRRERVKAWLLREVPRETEDHVFRLRSLWRLDAGEEPLRQSLRLLLELQREDGGWGQAEGISSDAYATGTVLTTLLETGLTGPSEEPVRRAIAWLLENQHADGSWHVVSRAEPFQTYFESGFPHGRDQFISIAASGWATWALLLSLERQVPEP